MGQSLGAGEQSLPIVSDSINEYGNFKFRTGTHTWNQNHYPSKPELRESSLFEFVPLTANRRMSEGETIANGLCDHFSSTTNINGNLLFSFSGQGGRLLRELNKNNDEAKDVRAGRRMSPGGYYKTSIDDVIRANEICMSKGLTYSVLAITWMQGEGNETRQTSRWGERYPRKKFLEIYKNDLIQVKRDYCFDISNVLKTKVSPPFFTYQTGGYVSGEAQLMACEEELNMYMIGPTYMLPNAENGMYDYNNKIYHGDGIHLTADGERWLGEQFGKIIRKVVIEKDDWQPLRPLKSYKGIDDNEIYIKFHVPEPPLVIDTLFLPKQGKGFGFQVYDESKKEYEISEVSVEGDDLIKLTLSVALKKEAFVKYANSNYVTEVTKPIFKMADIKDNSHGHELVSLIFEGNILKEFELLLKEGVFYLGNRVEDSNKFTNWIVRSATLNNNGNTVLHGEKEDLRKGIGFELGQKCYLSRRYLYGNIHDSDDEKSTYEFKDGNYGNRLGQNYPLFNWCISFRDLKIE